MKSKNLQFSTGFHVVMENRDAQAATMTLASGTAEGGPEGGPQSRHPGADQWLYIVSGSGTATINGKHHPVSEGILMLIEQGDEHEIRNTGGTPLRTLSVYVPPAYSTDGKELPAGRS